ncbi:Uncharacterised protein [Vibrio cholerae]|nr:Uncharacterised protein [Vibrio cholerae]
MSVPVRRSCLSRSAPLVDVQRDNFSIKQERLLVHR